MKGLYKEFIKLFCTGNASYKWWIAEVDKRNEVGYVKCSIENEDRWKVVADLIIMCDEVLKEDN